MDSIALSAAGHATKAASERALSPISHPAFKGSTTTGFKVYYGDGTVLSSGDPGVDWDTIPDENVQAVNVYCIEETESMCPCHGKPVPMRLFLNGFDYYWMWGSGNDLSKASGRVLKGKWMSKAAFDELRARAVSDYHLE